MPDVSPKTKQERIVGRDGLVPYHRAARPIRDEQGRVQVIIDFLEQAKDRYSDAARTALERYDPKRDRHHPQGLMFLDEKYRQYRLEPVYRRNERGVQERTHITTWVGLSMTAFLDEKQIETLRRDPDVRLLTENSVGRFSSTVPLWGPSWNHGLPWAELNDWGWHAVQGKSLIPTSNPTRVWILDSGVANHTEFNPYASFPAIVTSRVSVYSGPAVGCYSHATHVAGIIGARENNGQGRRGIFAGVDMRSVAVGDECGSNFPTDLTV